MKNKIAVFWFRRDLRLEDNAGLYHALASGFPVLPVFIFDRDILDKLEDKKDRRVDYLQQALVQMNAMLKPYGASLKTCYGKPMEVFKQLADEWDIQMVFCNRDYEPAAVQRDTEIYRFFQEKGIPFKAYKDQVIFDKKEVLKKDGTPYTVYTPYAKKWRELFQAEKPRPFSADYRPFLQQDFSPVLALEKIGFEKTDTVFERPALDVSIIDPYDKYRDFPALPQTTRLGIALRFGTISIRQCVLFADQHNQTWLSELIWREFFMQILYHFPDVVQHSFKKPYDHIRWRNNEAEFELWCQGKTGYPMVDAGMRQLNETGFMHNRVRMVVASFLCKHLLIDWRWGEAYFAQKLNDYDLSANNGNWQWAAGCGCDAAPYFRVFNPTTQMEKFDPERQYVKKWLPDFGTSAYPSPIVEHSFARERALQVYGEALKKQG